MAMNSRVFVIQRQQRWDSVKQELVDKFDIGPAEVFGTVVYLLSPRAAPFNSKSVIDELRVKLADYNDRDHLLLIGNPCLIGFAVAIAANQSDDGRVNLLQWSGRDQRYTSVPGTLF